jgi:hypothetical protein
MAKLNDLLVLLFHSITPPDRVGVRARRGSKCMVRSNADVWGASLQVIRRLKLGTTLVRNGSGSYTIDLTKMRHKTSKCTPSITCASPSALSDRSMAPRSLRAFKNLRVQDDCGMYATLHAMRNAPHSTSHKRPLRADLDKYVSLMQYEVYGESMYLFHVVSAPEHDWTRDVSSPTCM